MKYFVLLASLLFIPVSLHAQTGVKQDTTMILSPRPSAEELTRLFSETTQGKHDPFQVLPYAASFGKKVIPALRTFLFETPEVKTAVLDSNGQVTDSVIVPPPNRVYGIMVLDIIGTQAAYRVLTEAAESDSCTGVRGMALRSMAIGYYYKALEGGLSPDKEVVHLLLRNTEDTTRVAGCGMRIGEIAREGLENWTGIDYGDIPPDSVRVRFENPLGKTAKERREQWWQNRRGKIQWDKKARKFDVGDERR